MPDPTPATAPTVPAPVSAPVLAPVRVPPATPSAVPPPSPAAGRKVLERMLDRLFAALVNGPSVNCRPHRSRQRVDWMALAALNDVAPAEALRDLLGADRKATLKARVGQPRKRGGEGAKKRRGSDAEEEPPLTDQPVEEVAARGVGDAGGLGFAKPQAADSEDRDAGAEGELGVTGIGFEEVGAEPGGDPADARGAVASVDGADDDDDDNDKWGEQAALLQKLHIIAEDARTYEQDTGVHVLNVGFPLLSLPPAFASAAAGRQSSRRILAPIAFVPVSLVLRRGATRSVEVTCRADGVDLVQPNTALLAWLQRQTGRPAAQLGEAFADEKGEDPWREITELVARVCEMVDLPVPDGFQARAAGATNGAGAARDASSALTPGPADPGSAGAERGEGDRQDGGTATGDPSRDTPLANEEPGSE